MWKKPIQVTLGSRTSYFLPASTSTPLSRYICDVSLIEVQQSNSPWRDARDGAIMQMFGGSLLVNKCFLITTKM